MQYSQKLLLNILLCLFLVQCSNNSTSKKTDYIKELDNLTVYPADSEPAYSMKLLPMQTFGDSVEPYWSVIDGCFADDSGRLIIKGHLNGIISEFHVYNPDGTYHSKIGRFGRGPGEYESVSLFQMQAGKFFMYDQITGRLSMFSTTDYSFVGSSVIQDWNVRDLESVRHMKLSDFRARNDGNLLVIFKSHPISSGRTSNTKFMLVDTEGNVLNTEPLIELPSPYYIVGQNQSVAMFSSVGFHMAFKELSLYALSDDDAIYTAPETEDFLIKKYDAEGNYQYAFYYPEMGPPFDLDSDLNMMDSFKSVAKSALKAVDTEIPKTAPVLRGMRVDDENRIWVKIMVDRESDEWWILGESGELLAKTVLPNNETICDIQNGYLYAKYFNPQGNGGIENWETKVVKYSINLTEL